MQVYWIILDIINKAPGKNEFKIINNRQSGILLNKRQNIFKTNPGAILEYSPSCKNSLTSLFPTQLNSIFT